MKRTFSSHLRVVALTMWLGLAAGAANAVPTLQLGIEGGTYDSSTETIVATSTVFDLYAFLKPDTQNPFGDTYYLSMAITPQVNDTPADLGSFTYNGNTVNATADMTFGTPPVDTFFKDIPSHGMFPTYYTEILFSFDSSNQSGVFNVQDNPDSGPIAGSGMYYNLFSIDTSNLAVGYAIHFDLYNSNLKETCKKGDCTVTSGITQFAPFSHDAQSMTSVVPEPETYAMMLAGLGLLGFSARRRKEG